MDQDGSLSAIPPGKRYRSKTKTKCFDRYFIKHYLEWQKSNFYTWNIIFLLSKCLFLINKTA